MKFRTSRIFLVLLLCVLAAGPAFASAYDGQPKLIVIVIVDQLRADLLERGRSRFGNNGFRLLMDRGANFLNCNYEYANTVTAPGHATLLTGAYTDGHGILSNEWWDPVKKRVVAPVADDATRIVGIAGNAPGASPRNLLSDTLGDELRLATRGKSRVFTTSLKDRAAVFTGGFSANGVYWMDPDSGAWVSSTFYGNQLPKWVQDFNAGKRADKYWDLQWKDSTGKVMAETKRTSDAKFTEVVGATSFAMEYQFEFARELVSQEKLGNSGSTDLLVVSISTPDILGHRLGPDSHEAEELLVQLDSKLADFFSFLGRQVGLANTWIVLSADHGVSPLPEEAAKWRIPSAHLDAGQIRRQLNALISAQFHSQGEYVADVHWPQIFLSQDSFTTMRIGEADAERMVGDALLQIGMRRYFTKWQLARGDVPPGPTGQLYLNSYSPYGGWYVLGVPQPFRIAGSGTTHGSLYRYDTHVPLAFFGLPFRAGQYRTTSEPVDLAVTLASMLGINPPAAARGRVLTEMLVTNNNPSGGSGSPK